MQPWQQAEFSAAARAAEADPQRQASLDHVRAAARHKIDSLDASHAQAERRMAAFFERHPQATEEAVLDEVDALTAEARRARTLLFLPSPSPVSSAASSALPRHE